MREDGESRGGGERRGREGERRGRREGRGGGGEGAGRHRGVWVGPARTGHPLVTCECVFRPIAGHLSYWELTK